MGSDEPPKRRGIRIVDPRKIGYTYIVDDNGFKINSSVDDKDNSALKKKTEKDIQRIRHDITKKENIRNKGRITGGQSKQGVSSVYE
jgi:hypothetical protein